MKNKILIPLFCAIAAIGSAQTQTSSTPTVVTDALHYYFNKFYFKTGVSDLNLYPYYKCPAATGTAVTYCGSRFDVPAGETVTVTGLEAFMRKGPGDESGSPSVMVELSLCNLDAQGLPILPAVDAVTFSVVDAVHTTSMNLLGANFPNPHVLSNSFAVLFRNLSTTSGDTVRLMRTAGLTPTAAAASPSNQCSDGGYGYVRFLGQFYSTRNFQFTPSYSTMPGFGLGTDYEFVVAPRVTYSIQASEILPDKVYLTSNTVSPADTVCTRTVFTFTNTSSKFFEHRMYNLNHFYLKWALTGPFLAAPQAPGGFSQDSAITWRFEAYDLKGEQERVFLPYVNTGTVSFVTDRRSSLDLPDYCYLSNQFRTRLRPMSIYGSMPMYVYDENFKMCLKYCNGDEDGVSEIPGFEQVKLYPNPTATGKITIRGLSGRTQIAIYDVMGRLVVARTSADSVEINLESQPAGTYFVKMSNLNAGTSASTKIVKQN